jgi:hypothetical protein
MLLVTGPLQLGGDLPERAQEDVMSDAALRAEWSSAPGERVARMANLVCEATRRVALDGITSALQAVEGRPPQAADVVRDIAEPILSRATIMQIEIDRFMATARCRPGTEVSARAAEGGCTRRAVDARPRRVRE